MNQLHFQRPNIMLSSIRQSEEKLKIVGSKGSFYGCAIWFWATVITTAVLIAFYFITHGDEIWMLLAIGAVMWGIYFLGRLMLSQVVFDFAERKVERSDGSELAFDAIRQVNVESVIVRRTTRQGARRVQKQKRVWRLDAVVDDEADSSATEIVDGMELYDSEDNVASMCTQPDYLPLRRIAARLARSEDIPMRVNHDGGSIARPPEHIDASFSVFATNDGRMAPPKKLEWSDVPDGMEVSWDYGSYRKHGWLIACAVAGGVLLTLALLADPIESSPLAAMVGVGFVLLFLLPMSFIGAFRNPGSYSSHLNDRRVTWRGGLPLFGPRGELTYDEILELHVDTAADETEGLALVCQDTRHVIPMSAPAARELANMLRASAAQGSM